MKTRLTPLDLFCGFTLAAIIAVGLLAGIANVILACWEGRWE